MVMGLYAILKNKPIYSFQYSEEEWKDLKKQYNDGDLLMPCCNQKGIQKKNQYGTLFFSHYRRGKCLDDNDDTLRIYICFLIGKIASANDYEVLLNYTKELYTGSIIESDVYCKKEDSDISFKVQFQQMVNSDIKSKQIPFNINNIRNLWIYDMRGFKNYKKSSLPYEQNTPVFGVDYDRNERKIFLPQFSCNVETFIKGIFEKSLFWNSKLKEWKLYDKISSLK